MYDGDSLGARSSCWCNGPFLAGNREPGIGAAGLTFNAGLTFVPCTHRAGVRAGASSRAAAFAVQQDTDMEGQGVEVVCFTVIVDDIVLPNGETVMEVLGGGGPQTLFGYQLVTGQTAAVGLSAGVGPDMPERCKVGRTTMRRVRGCRQRPTPTGGLPGTPQPRHRNPTRPSPAVLRPRAPPHAPAPQFTQAWLRSIGCDVSGLIVHDRPTPRAWQVRSDLPHGARYPCPGHRLCFL